MIGLAVVANSAYAQSGGQCATGAAVTEAVNNPGLVSDCEVLLAAQDNLSGAAGLNWSVGVPIDEWDGITVSEAAEDTVDGEPQRVIELELGAKGCREKYPRNSPTSKTCNRST